MSGELSVGEARDALTRLPEATSYGETPPPEHVYVPPSHLKAMDPNNMLVTGMRGAGKTFWWSALQNPDVRRIIRQTGVRSALSEGTKVRTGFGITPSPDEYPGRDDLRRLIKDGTEPRTIWRTVQVRQLADEDHPLLRATSWPERTKYVEDHPGAVERLLYDKDADFVRSGTHFLLLFDALDRSSDDWSDMYRLIRGLMQHALDMRAYRRLRVKVFLRSDQVDKTRMADFPDASKVLSSAVELNWPRRHLYGLLWHYLANGEVGATFRSFLGNGDWRAVDLGQKRIFSVPRRLVNDDDLQRDRFHVIAGPWMGTDRRRGLPYTWIPNHLGDTEGKVSPRSFLDALQIAAEDTAEQQPDHAHALHYSSIHRGVQQASRTRVDELREDYPWVHQVLEPLRGLTVPCRFADISRRWRTEDVLNRLKEEAEQSEVKLPPRQLDDGAQGVREDLESLHVFLRLRDGRVNIPDVFRVGYGLGRKGGVKPVR